MRRFEWSPAGALIAFALLVAITCVQLDAESASAGDPYHKHHAGWNTGVLKQPFHHPHHRGGCLAHQKPSPPHGPPRFAYGFQTESFRWGWFGAERFYPRTSSHAGYNDSYKQWAYRHGY